MTRTRYSLFFLLLVLALVAVFVACGDDDEEEGVDSTADAFATATLAPTQVGQTQPPAETAPPVGDCPDPSDDAPEVSVKSYPAAPEMTIDPAKEYIATLKTVRGDVTIKLRPDLAPHHVNSFVFLAREGYYNGVTFHRVIPGFVAQAGDPTGTGSGGPGYTVPGEFSDPSVARFERGTLGMARTTDPNSAGSQWFINYAATPNLDGSYTIFGEVTAGMEVVDCITPRDPSTNPNAGPGDKIISIDIAEN